MSRLAKQPIAIPAGVEASITDGNVVLKGAKGELSRVFKTDVISVELKDGAFVLGLATESVFSKALIGTYASHLMNMLEGVTKGFEKKLIVEGVGFRSEVKGKQLHMQLGFSHPVVMEIPEGITATAEKNLITITGNDKERTNQFAAQIRAKKKPEPYKGKGIRYEGEIIRRKQGKKSA
ncbi:MAG: 50S ribosomal protein L6 [Candidatus Pacebacteria bacterium]|nr:50S ribosomal protein L6 [Candidatus Paceibacterota bacterium]